VSWSEFYVPLIALVFGFAFWHSEVWTGEHHRLEHSHNREGAGCSILINQCCSAFSLEAARLSSNLLPYP
jgi:hypothetical protein